jgi:hypothetical protein
MQTKLAAVNSLLQVIGESPVNEVDRSNPDVLAALQILDEKLNDIQSTGYWYNVETWELPVATDDFVYLPSNTITVVTGNNNYVKRGRRLYNLDTHSYDFSDSDTVSMDIITEWDIEELPPVMFNYIVAGAKVDMVASFAMDSTLLQKLTSDYIQAYHRLQVQNLKAQAPNATASGAAQTLLQNQPQR